MYERIEPPVRSDLHTHTLCSDGRLSPEEYIDYANEHDLKILALTDHDNMNGVIPAERYIMEHNLALRLIPGIEFSSKWDDKTGGRHQIHVVGLCCDQTNKRFQELVHDNKVRRDGRVEYVTKKLIEAGLEADPLNSYINEIIERGTFVTRKHFADYLIKVHLATDLKDAFKKYLGNGGVAYYRIEWNSIDHAVETIKAAGGIPILAHPTRYDSLKDLDLLEQLVKHFVACGGEGIEVAHPRMQTEDRIIASFFAQKYKLYASYGSDFHHEGVPERAMGEDLWMFNSLKPIWEHEKIKPYFKDL